MAVRARRNRRKKSLLRPLRNLLAVAAVAVVPAALLTTPHLAVGRVVVAGAQQLNARDVVAVTGIKRGQNLLLVRKGAVERRVRLLPLVERVRVRRIPPDTVRVDVTERQAVAVLSTGGRSFLIDRFRVPFRTLRSGEKPTLRVISTPAVNGMCLGKPLRSRAVDAAFECLSIAASRLPKTTSVAVDAHLDTCLNIGAFEVRLGQPEQLRRKIELCGALLRQKPEILANGEYLDVSVPESPAWKPRSDVANPDGSQVGTAGEGAGPLPASSPGGGHPG